jgi:hypothetical protein
MRTDALGRYVGNELQSALDRLDDLYAENNQLHEENKQAKDLLYNALAQVDMLTATEIRAFLFRGESPNVPV